MAESQRGGARRPSRRSGQASPPSRPSVDGEAVAHVEEDERPSLGQAVVLLVTLTAAKATLLLAFGTGLYLDDWGVLDERRRGGLLAIEPVLQETRPVGWLVKVVVFGLGGDHPNVLFLLVAAGCAGVAVLLHLALRNYVAPAVALAVAAAWVLMPNHNTVTIWASTVPLVAALALTLGGILLLDRRRWLLAALCLGAAVLSYELVLPACVLAAVLLGPGGVVPARRARPGDDLRRRDRAVVLFVVGACALWSATQSPYELTVVANHPLVVWSAHLGSGLLPAKSVPVVLRLALGLVTLVGTMWVVGRWLWSRARPDLGVGLVLGGLVLMAAGVAPAMTRHLVAMGMIDRLYAVSSIGAAMVVVGLGVRLASRSRQAAGAAAAVLLVVCVVGQVIAARSWSDAGHDGRRLLAELAARDVDPAERTFVVLGGPDDRNGVIALTEASGAHAAFKVTFGDGDGTLVIGRPDFEAEQRVVVRWEGVADDGQG